MAEKGRKLTRQCGEGGGGEPEVLSRWEFRRQYKGRIKEAVRGILILQQNMNIFL